MIMRGGLLLLLLVVVLWWLLLLLLLLLLALVLLLLLLLLIALLVGLFIALPVLLLLILLLLPLLLLPLPLLLDRACVTVPIRCISSVCDATDLNTGVANSCVRVRGGGRAGSRFDFSSSSNGQHMRSILANRGMASHPGSRVRLRIRWGESSPPGGISAPFLDDSAAPVVAPGGGGLSNAEEGRMTSNCQ